MPQTNEIVPQGSGDITGILVHERRARYGNDIGRYAVRHLKRLRVKNKTVGTATNPTGGTLAASGITRLGHISIKYNK